MAVRRAVATALADLDEGARVLVACSGGPDSLALVAATAWAAPRAGLRVQAVVVDHGLQGGSHLVAEDARQTCELLGVPAEVIHVEVGRSGGPEAAAREARYAALTAAAERHVAAAVLLGHTLEDQAETVLLRLARGSGARSLAAMSRRNGLWRRPLLDVPREVVRTVAAEALEPLGRSAWSDPHNDDPTFARVRVREVLPDVDAAVGGGAVLGLARSADLLRDDADALDGWAEEAYAEHVKDDTGELSAECAELAALPAAVRTRVIRLMALAAGAPGEALGLDRVRTVDALVVDWHGQGPASLPGGVRAARVYGRLCLQPSRPETSTSPTSSPRTGAASGA